MLFAIGDIHGHFDKLLRLMRHCREFARQNSQSPRFVLLGDYIDRGPDSRKVLELLCSRPPDVLAIVGNHEDMLLQSLGNSQAAELWYQNGGLETLLSYRAALTSEIPAAHIDLIRSLPVFIDDGIRLFVHAGIDPANFENRNRQVLLWTRKHPDGRVILPRLVVHGHTPTHSRKPELLPNRLNLDTGAGWGRRLTAAAFHDNQARPIAFLDDLGERPDAVVPTQT